MENLQNVQASTKEKYLQAVQLTREKVTIHELINFDNIPKNPVKVSIVVPVCNVEQYLRECLDSCVNQTLKDIEIICVNDGSTDGCLEILKEYAAADSRVKVIDKDNAGYGHTMNLGMDMAAGEYIGIVESDDFVDLKMYEELYRIAKEKELDFIKADFYRFVHDENGDIKKDLNRVAARAPELYNVVTNANTDHRVFHLVMQTWSGIYKNSYLKKNNIRHNETPGASFQDNGFWFQTLMYAQRAFFYDKPFYMNRRDNPNSSVHNKEKVYCMNQEYKFIYDLLIKDKDLYEEYKYEYSRKKFLNYMSRYEVIGQEFKQEFLYRVKLEFLEAVKSNEIRENVFLAHELEELEWIAEDPDDYYAQHSENSIRVSVIIPVYNSEEYLRQCLDSVLSQTLQKIEVICVDDGSEDNSVNILREYELKDKRLKILTQEHRGAGAARNKGLASALGEYLSFLDSDDFFEQDMLESIYERCKKTHADIGVFRVKNYDNNTKKTSSDKNSFVKENFPKKDFFAPSELGDKIFDTFQTWAWNKLFRRHFVEKEGLLFQEINRTNDMFFVNTALIRAYRITALDRELVYYRRETENSCQATNYLYPTDFFKALLALKEQVEKSESEAYMIGFQNLAVKSCMYNLNSLKNADAFASLYRFLHAEGFTPQNIDVLSFEKENIFNNNLSPYYESIKIASGTFEEYMFEKLVFFRKKIKENTNKIAKLSKDLENERLESKFSQKMSRLEHIEDELNKLKLTVQQKEDYKMELILTRASTTYKIGRFITWLPRKIRGIFKKS